VSPAYPDDSVQTLTSAWWVDDKGDSLVRGRMVWTWVPYPEMKPYRLIPEGRGDAPRQHSRAAFRIETFRIGDPAKGITTLPVAALPVRDGESYLVQRGKRRPAVVIATGGVEIPKEVRRGDQRWQSARSVLVAPYYGAEPGATRGGWPTSFVERIRRAEYPQYMWDMLPLGTPATESILRLDHLFAVGGDPSNWKTEPYVLSPEALRVLDEWVSWSITGILPEDSGLAFARSSLGSA
jgi:hypothetical protein